MSCSRSKGEVKASVNSINLFTFESSTSPPNLKVYKICGVEVTVYADTGVSCSISREKLYHMLQKIIILPEAKGNRTLLETDFIKSAGIVLDVLNGTWHF
ncbi:uncharacterized protein NPIL_313631 [Nephila pilipes]|uniref:Uncharacterized protein n=1 Tax=Nephila pilipes TaxID=299642 RepID=A0A8X6P5K4_NEPPI|nr:uncharacterized protein NPIL_313631 [Nephila pilipes]